MLRMKKGAAMSDHDCGHDHGDGHGMSPYQFFQTLLAGPLDETLLFNVSDPAFWVRLRPQLENERTAEALDHVEAAVEALTDIPEDRRKMVLDYEYAMCFLDPDAPMPPLECAQGMPDDPVAKWAVALGVLPTISRFLPDDHIANELAMLVPLDDPGSGLDPDRLALLARFFEAHPLELARRMAQGKRHQREGSGFYRGIVELTAAWLQWDLDAFEDGKA